MKQLVWSPSSINFGSRKKGESVTAESTLSITEGSVLLTPGKISPVPWAGYPVQLKNTEGSLHIHPAFSFAAAKYYLTSAGALTTNRDIAELYLGNAGAGAGLPFLPVPITLVILTPPGEFDPADPVTVNYTSGAILWVKVFFKINDSEWFFYDTFNATGTFDIDLSGWSFDHGDVLTVKVQDDESESFYDTVAFTAMVATITIDSINNGLPLTYEGLFEDGMWYFADTTGTKVVDQNDPDRSEWFIGTGTADGDIDLDIKMLAITDVVVPETVQLGVAFDISGNYVMLEPRIVIEAFDGVTWKKIHAGDYIEVADGSFTESVTIESAYGFIPNTSVTIRVRSYDGYALNGIDSTDVIATVIMKAITGMVDGTPYTLEGTTDSDTVEIWVDDGTGYIKKGDAVVVGSAWSYDITLSAGTYGVKAIDGTDSRGYAEQTGVEVESATPANPLFVASDATGSNDGTSWENAFTDLQTAIDTAVSGQEVWVKQGTYYPSAAVGGLGEERDKAFYLKTGVAVYGGFTGADYIFANRDYTANETICHANGNYHVFHFKNKDCDRTAILDGFTVRGANGNNTTDNRDRGGGFSFPTGLSHPTIRNCKITANSSIYGSAIRTYTTSSPIFENCLIYDNGSDYAIIMDYLQGGVAMTNRFTLSKCTIYNTSLKSQRCIQGWDGNCDGIVIDGCTFYNWNNFHVIRLVSSPNHQPNIINRCTFYNNYAALKLDMSTINSHQHQVSNCIIRNNTYGIYGSGYASLYYGCTLTANTYALYNWNDVNKGDFANCIIYGNTNMFARAGYNNFTFTHSDCQTAQSGTGNISINPNWDANYRLNAGSPCVDVGDNTKVYGDYDLDGNPRIVNTTVDMGCYERQ